MKKNCRISMCLMILLIVFVCKVNIALAASVTDVKNASASTKFIAIYLGDVNHDGKVDNSDVNYLMQRVPTNNFTGAEKIAGDLDFNGKVNNRDVVVLMDLVNQTFIPNIVFIPATTSGSDKYEKTDTTLNFKMLYKSINASDFQNKQVRVYLGDLNSDGKVNNSDFVLLKSIIGGSSATDAQKIAGNVNGGNSLNDADVTALQTSIVNGKRLSVYIPLTVDGALNYLISDTSLNNKDMYEAIDISTSVITLAELKTEIQNILNGEASFNAYSFDVQVATSGSMYLQVDINKPQSYQAYVRFDYNSQNGILSLSNSSTAAGEVKSVITSILLKAYCNLRGYSFDDKGEIVGVFNWLFNKTNLNLANDHIEYVTTTLNSIGDNDMNNYNSSVFSNKNYQSFSLDTVNRLKSYEDTLTIIPNGEENNNSESQTLDNYSALVDFYSKYLDLYGNNQELKNIELTPDSFTINRTINNELVTTIFDYSEGVLSYKSGSDADVDKNNVNAVLAAFARLKGYVVSNYILWTLETDNLTLDKDGIEYGVDSDNNKITFAVNLVNGSKTFESSEYNKTQEIEWKYDWDMDDFVNHREHDSVKDEVIDNPKTTFMTISLGVLSLACVGVLSYLQLKKKGKFIRL